jgi:hypothetical protein
VVATSASPEPNARRREDVTANCAAFVTPGAIPAQCSRCSRQPYWHTPGVHQFKTPQPPNHRTRTGLRRRRPPALTRELPGLNSSPLKPRSEKAFGRCHFVLVHQRARDPATRLGHGSPEATQLVVQRENGSDDPVFSRSRLGRLSAFARNGGPDSIGNTHAVFSRWARRTVSCQARSSRPCQMRRITMVSSCRR